MQSASVLIKKASRVPGYYEDYLKGAWASSVCMRIGCNCTITKAYLNRKHGQ